MELDYFTLYLQNYLRDHGFELADIASPFAAENAELAAEAHEHLLRNGSTPEAARELALETLFACIGESPREVVAELLLNNFQDRLEIGSQSEMEHWIARLSESPALFDGFHQTPGLGLSRKKIEDAGPLLRDRVDKYFSAHGI